MVKNLPVNAGDIRDSGSILELGRSPGGGHGSPLQYPCPEKPVDRGAWRATVHGVTQSQTQVKRLSTHKSGAEHGSKDKPVNKIEKSFLQFFQSRINQSKSQFKYIYIHTHTHTYICAECRVLIIQFLK